MNTLFNQKKPKAKTDLMEAAKTMATSFPSMSHVQIQASKKGSELVTFTHCEYTKGLSQCMFNGVSWAVFISNPILLARNLNRFLGQAQHGD